MKNTLKNKGKTLKLTILGFTLIELLAVIVILAIIALIAIPIVLGIIEDTKRSATLRSAEFYLDAVENLIATSTLNNIKISSGEYNIMSDGNICLGTYSKTGSGETCTDEDGIEGNETLKVEVSGEVPTSGTVEISSGNIADVKLEFKDTKPIIKNQKGELVYDEVPTPEPKSFAEDDWSTIVANLNSDVYKVGDTREIELTGFSNTETDSNGLYTIRIANKTNTEDVCTNNSFTKEDGTIETYSKTACGFVIEFEDIILNSGDNAKMNLTNTNVGGWKDSKMRTYVNDTIYNALPNDLRDVIIDTTVVSGHGSTSGETNFVTTDKVYLLSTGEVWEQGTSNTINQDTARDNTRQLDYYKDEAKVTTSSYGGAIKKINGSAYSWWLRSAYFGSTYRFYGVYDNGDWSDGYASAYGVAVAFRIG